MLLKKFGLAAGLCSAGTLLATAALAMPVPWEIGFQPAASPVMERIESFHTGVLYIVTLICIFVFGLQLWIIIRYNHRSNPVPGKTTHNTLLEVAWTIVPVIILVVIAIPSFKLLYFEADVPPPDVTIKAIGHQWFWSYQYPASNFQFDSLGLSDADALKKGEPRLLGVDNVVVVPVNKVVKVLTTGADVIHSWAVPQFGVKMDAIPGRLNVTWFKALYEGTYYGECSELCGARHAYMPIEVKVVSQNAFNAWLRGAKKKFASISGTGDGTRVAAAGK
ncbi:MAG TPA: cytochrome c oxidase subunit II [Rhizomicrobium sp.]|jgi:cytochrome c oxidase subunit 2|nr:cytochrome c oxidase subunit II [Rhizomicrobium sp.]